MSSPLYIDLDHTLQYAVYKDATKEEVERFVFRPGAHEFLAALQPYGELILLTASDLSWASEALASRPDLSKQISGIISWEKLEPVSEKLQEIFSMAGISDYEKIEMTELVPAIAEPGVVFDDQPYWSGLYFVKAVAVGILKLPDLWIQVPEFSKNSLDRAGLEGAFREFKRRNKVWNRHGIRYGMMGNRKGMELSSRRGYTSGMTAGE